jgi:hypothetical protein
MMEPDHVRKLLLRRAKGFSRYKGNSGVGAWCKAHNVSRAHASEFLNGKRLPTTDLLNALGLEWRIMRRRAA